MAVIEFSSGGIITLTNDHIHGAVRFAIPDGTPWSRNEVRFWTRRQPLNEFGYLYIALFILGTYARYYPDKWQLDVQLCTPLALATEALVALAEERMAWLALNELTRVCFVPE